MSLQIVDIRVDGGLKSGIAGSSCLVDIDPGGSGGVGTILSVLGNDNAIESSRTPRVG